MDEKGNKVKTLIIGCLVESPTIKCQERIQGRLRMDNNKRSGH